MLPGTEKIEPKNTVKISALFCLSLIDMAGRSDGVTAGMIAQGIGGTRDSLYILLSRWVRWRMVRKIDAKSPYRYKLAPGGRAYLNRLDNWFSTADKLELYYRVLSIMKPLLYWKVNGRNFQGQEVTALCRGLRYPYQGAEDFIVVYPDKEGQFFFFGSHKLTIKQANTLSALETIKAVLFMEPGQELIDKLVAEHILKGVL